MSSIRDHIAKLQRLRADLPGLATSLMQDYGDTSVALRKEDSIERGINKEGKENAKVQYSDKLVPTYWFAGKELNQGGRTYVKENKTGNWYGLRQAEGLRSQNVNLTHTGDSWKGYKVLNVTVTSGLASAQIGVTGNHAEVFLHNVKRYGKFYLNTPTELARLRENADNTSHNWLKSYLA